MIIALQSLIYYYFRESILRLLDRLFRPYYNKSLTPSLEDEDEETEVQVFAEYHEEKGVVFYPPVYQQRYAAVSDCLMDKQWRGELEKVVDIGFHDMSFIKYLKEVPGIQSIVGVDIERIPLQCFSDLVGGGYYVSKKDNSTQIHIRLFQGNAADPDYRLIGADAVVAIEMIEHMLPHDLERLVHTIFGFIKPRIAVITTPNGDFNVLFKALESNGLRRLDHFFEWSREQFHDWCSNIVQRYPEYSVSCVGVAPGPAGTEHLGCCSQLALFVCKDYRKQQELTLDSLALVSQAPSPNNFEEILDSCSSRDDLTESESSNSQTSLSDSQSSVTIFPPPSRYHSNGQCDTAAQCNIDKDSGKTYLMEVDQSGINVVEPRRGVRYKMYQMEDVACRLNCTTLKVKKFSKSTQKLMAKNKNDSLIHTRDVVTQIKQLTKLLNFKDRRRHCDHYSLWNNINWGENAPYWNQYYKLVKEYDYPFQEKPQDSIILELVSDEIHQLIDLQVDEEMASSDSRLEVPLEYLMRAVDHLTQDVDKVSELLEWNGYEVSNGLVTYSRQLPDELSDSSDDWRDDYRSEGDTTDVQSLTLSDGSKVLENYHTRLRRALEHKIRKLRSMSAEEDITMELERVVCRLLKLALNSSKGRSQPPPPWWLQCKLYDLLSLSERAIQRRRMHFLKTFQICDDDDTRSTETASILTKFKEDTTAQKIMDKYRHLVEAPADDDMNTPEYYDDINLETDKTSTNSTTEYIEEIIKEDENIEKQLTIKDDNLARTKAWLEDDVTLSISSHTVLTHVDTSIPKVAKVSVKIRKMKKQNKSASRLWKKSHSNLKCLTTNTFCHHKKTNDDGSGKEKDVDKKSLLSNPILEEKEVNKKGSNVSDKNIDLTGNSEPKESNKPISASEQGLVIDIITEGHKEKVALLRSVGTEPVKKDSEVEIFVAEVENEHGAPLAKHQTHHKLIDDAQLFLYDINEPSTSKGIHHRKTDVQCGPDVTEIVHYPSPKESNAFAAVKVGDSLSNMLTVSKKSVDFGTCTQDEHVKVMSSRNVSVGIRIKDSESNLACQANDTDLIENEMKFLKPVSSSLKIKDSVHEICSSRGKTSPSHTINPSPVASVGIETVQLENVREFARKSSPPKFGGSKLTCAAVHIHSNKDRQGLEDVVFQGGWRPIRLKKQPRKKAILVVKKSDSTLKRTLRSKEKLAIKKSIRSCNMAPAPSAFKKSGPTFAHRMNIVKQDIARKAELGKKFRDPTSRKVGEKKSSPTSKIPKACLVSKSVSPKSILIIRKDSKNNAHTRSRVPLPKKANDRKFKNKAKPIRVTNATTLQTYAEKNQLETEVKAKILDLKKSLFKTNPNPNLSYMVFRSEVTTSKNSTRCTSPVSVKMIENVRSPDRNSSGSSRISVSTVRALRVHSPSISPVKSTTKLPETEASTSKQHKKGKKAKDANDNKENSSLASGNSNSSTKEAIKPNKPFFTGKNKNIFVSKRNLENTKMQENVTSVLTKPVNQTERKSVSKIPKVSKVDKMKTPTLSQKTMSPKISMSQKEKNIVDEIKKNIAETDVIVVTSTPKKDIFFPIIEPEVSLVTFPVITNTFMLKDFEELKSEIQVIVETCLDFLQPAKDEFKKETLTPASSEKTESSKPNTAKKEKSAYSLNRTMNTFLAKESASSVADTALTMTDTDFMSFKSMTSISKVSEYYLAEMELEEQATNSNPVLDLFERKEQLQMQIPPNLNPIAMQAFSGLSMGAEPLVGDRRDHINLQDSETGSMAVPYGRQITSEEFFISGRSSTSFESGWTENDNSVVPDWLFQALNHPSIAEEDVITLQLPIEIPPPNDEQTYDENGNTVPVHGVSAGAGDGCGMHSDLSEDTSDDTLSSSDDTSGAEQSESILMDPTTIAAHYEAFREAISSATLRIDSRLDDTSETLEETNGAQISLQPPLEIANSGFEADVSSSEETSDVPLARSATRTDQA